MKRIKTIRINIIFVIIVVFIFLCLIIKLVYVGTGNIKVGSKTLAEFASDRDTVKKTTYARRGTIYASKGEVLAKDVNSYTVIAYLDPSRTKDESRPYHVVDKEMTASKLSPIINMKKETILDLLNTKIESCDENNVCTLTPPYQVELGPGGRGITELVKDQIEALDLPGIDFISSTKRYYPNGDFLSYTLGYAKRNDDGDYIGEMGLELFYNKELTGTNGYIEYQSDLYGYQITSKPSVEKKSVPGNDIYLTIDNNIQMFTEQARTELESGKPEWATVAVMNAKTGEILGVSSSPSFNNNTLEIKSYYDPFVAYNYEPGSTMKIFSFMSAMESGIYKGREKYKSGKIEVDDATIRDWNKYGWGNITYDEGFMGSSNVAATKLGLSLGRAKLKDYYNSLGFGSKVGIGLPNEGDGIVNFRYNTEVAAASFGQGITVTAVQMLQALSTIANNGTMIKPYLVSKITNENGETILENKRTEIRKVYSEETVKEITKLMRGVVDGTSKISTGTGYHIDGYDIIGKTGTAEIASSSGGYLTGSTNNIRSFAALYPGNNPEIIIYIAASKIQKSSYMNTAFKNLAKNVGTYLNIYDVTSTTDSSVSKLDSYINNDITYISSKIKALSLIPIVIGDGNKVINQYPVEGTSLSSGNKVFLLTNAKEIKLPDIKGWSRSEVEYYCSLANLKVKFEGFGYVKSYNIKEGSIIKKDDTLEVILESKYEKK